MTKWLQVDCNIVITAYPLICINLHFFPSSTCWICAWCLPQPLVQLFHLSVPSNHDFRQISIFLPSFRICLLTYSFLSVNAHVLVNFCAIFHCFCLILHSRDKFSCIWKFFSDTSTGSLFHDKGNHLFVWTDKNHFLIKILVTLSFYWWPALSVLLPLCSIPYVLPHRTM